MTNSPRASTLSATEQMTMWQWFAVLICVFLNVVDGFDILVMSAAAPSVKVDLGLSTAQLGVILSASLAGMTLGALLIAPIADRIGRRPVILLCLALEFAGMLLAGFSASPTELILCRLVAGLGVGGMMPVINTATSELASPSQRNLAITIQAIGYPLGGTLAALTGIIILEDHGWRTLLQLACIPTLAAALLVLLFLPESVDYLVARRPADALPRVNKALRALGKSSMEALPQAGDAKREGLSTLIRQPMLAPFMLFSLATFATQFSFYFFLSWLPTILAPALGTISFPNAGSFVLNLGGIVGDIIFAILCLGIAARNLTLGALGIAFASTTALGFDLSSPALLILLPLIAGGALFGAMAGIYATAPRVFPPLVRASGTGFAFSLGRFGGALSPVVGGIALGQAGLGTVTALILLAVPLLVAAALLAFLKERQITPL